MSAAGLSGKLGSSQSTILHAINRMAAEQIVEKCAEGYQLTGAGLVQDSILQQTADGLAVRHLPTTEVVGLPLRKKSRGVWQGDSSP